jgi:outer membrane protein W
MATTKIRPYLGAGLGYVQEIDIDLESGGVERSYNQDGEFAYQLMAGITYPITEAIDLDAGLRYVRAESINFERESGDGELRKVDYDPILFTIGLSYKF